MLFVEVLGLLKGFLSVVRRFTMLYEGIQMRFGFVRQGVGPIVFFLTPLQLIR